MLLNLKIISIILSRKGNFNVQAEKHKPFLIAPVIIILIHYHTVPVNYPNTGQNDLSMTFSLWNIPQYDLLICRNTTEYNYIVYFNTQPTFLKLTKLVAMTTFILFQTCLKIEFC